MAVKAVAVSQMIPIIKITTTSSIIVPGSNSKLNIFAGNNDIEIPWKNIKCIGDDIILVEI